MTSLIDHRPFTSRWQSNPHHGTKGLSYDDSFTPLAYRRTCRIWQVLQSPIGMRRYIMIAVLLPVGRDQIHMTVPRNILTTITLYHWAIEVFIEFDKYFDRRVVLGERRRMSFDTVMRIRFLPVGKRDCDHDVDGSPFTSRWKSNPRHGTKGNSYDDSYTPLGYRSTYRIR